MEKTILVKLSGESLAGNNADKRGLDDEYVTSICTRIKKLHDSGMRIGIVSGGGNFMRGGRTSKIINREVADYMGMMGTVMNALALYDGFNRIGCPAYLQSGLSVAVPMTDEINPGRALEALADGKIVIFGGGTGHPGCTTDTASALRARDIKANMILKLTNVDGVYDKDPHVYEDAKKYEEVTFKEVLDQELGVMDLEAMEMCMEDNIEIVVMNIDDESGYDKIIKGEKIGTRVYND